MIKNVRRDLTISRRRLRTKRWPKFGDYIRIAAVAIPNISDATPANRWLTIWATTGNDGTNPYMYIPYVLVQAPNNAGTLAGLAQYIGNAGGENAAVGDRQWMYTHLDLRFSIYKTITKAASIAGFIRLTVITARHAITGLADFIPTNNINNPINPRDWKVRFDKVFSVDTGLYANPAGGTTVTQSKGAWGPKNFKFRIPFKYRAEINPTGGIWEPPLNTWVLITSTENNIWSVADIWCRQYFRDLKT